jgi:ketosteroid isomerase-like protein
MRSPEGHAFVEATLDEQVRAERALHNGDVTPRLSTWSHHDPVTCFGAAVPLRSGWPDIRSVFDRLAETFVSCDEYDFELVAADAGGNLAYTVGFERYRATTADGREVNNTLRVTHVYRREAAGWKILHRHGDHVPDDRTGS